MSFEYPKLYPIYCRKVLQLELLLQVQIFFALFFLFHSLFPLFHFQDELDFCNFYVLDTLKTENPQTIDFCFIDNDKLKEYCKSWNYNV